MEQKLECCVTQPGNDLDLYQRDAAQFARFNATATTAMAMHDTLYLATAFAGEVGEACNVIKKMSRDDRGYPGDERIADLKAELGDCLWYLSQLAAHFGFSLSEIAADNLAKLAERQRTG